VHASNAVEEFHSYTYPVCGWCNLLVCKGTSQIRADGPAALMMAAFFLAFGICTILRPEKVRAVMDGIVDRWKKGSWHPYRMPTPVLRFTVGSIGIPGSAVFAYIAYVALTQ
jgi:hypothetical protein